MDLLGPCRTDTCQIWGDVLNSPVKKTGKKAVSGELTGDKGSSTDMRQRNKKMKMTKDQRGIVILPRVRRYAGVADG